MFPFIHPFFIYSVLSLQIGNLITKVQVINTNVFERERRITASDFMSNKSCEPYDWSLTREKWIFIIWVTYKVLKYQKSKFTHSCLYIKRFVYTNFLINGNSFYANFTNTTFQKIPIPHLTRTMTKKRFCFIYYELIPPNVCLAEKCTKRSSVLLRDRR